MVLFGDKQEFSVESMEPSQADQGQKLLLTNESQLSVVGKYAEATDLNNETTKITTLFDKLSI